MDWVTWLSAVELPAFAWMVWHLVRTRAELVEFKLEVARKYASLDTLREVEGRLTTHLVRIEDKLEAALNRSIERK